MNTAVTYPDPQQIWTVRDMVLVAQQMMCRFIDAGDWVWASKLLARAERLSRRLPESENPFFAAGGGFTIPRARARKRAAEQPPSAPAPPPTQEEKQSVLSDSDEALHADFAYVLAMQNESNASNGLPPVSFDKLLEVWAQEFGPEIARRVAAHEASLRRDAPSG